MLSKITGLFGKKLPDEFHGFFYTEKKGNYYGLELPSLCKQGMERAVAPPFPLIGVEKYWLSFARFMMMPAPNSYVAWRGISYWAVQLPRVDDNHNFTDDKNGIHLLQFNPNRTFGYKWLEERDYADLKESATDIEFLYSVIYGGFDWSTSGNGDGKMFRMSKPQIAAMKANIIWTDEVHTQMQRKYPPEKHWG